VRVRVRVRARVRARARVRVRVGIRLRGHRLGQHAAQRAVVLEQQREAAQVEAALLLLQLGAEIGLARPLRAERGPLELDLHQHLVRGSARVGARARARVRVGVRVGVGVWGWGWGVGVGVRVGVSQHLLSRRHVAVVLGGEGLEIRRQLGCLGELLRGGCELLLQLEAHLAGVITR